MYVVKTSIKNAYPRLPDIPQEGNSLAQKVSSLLMPSITLPHIHYYLAPANFGILNKITKDSKLLLLFM